jgi:hypothetical protein
MITDKINFLHVKQRSVKVTALKTCIKIGTMIKLLSLAFETMTSYDP